MINFEKLFGEGKVFFINPNIYINSESEDDILEDFLTEMTYTPPEPKKITKEEAERETVKLIKFIKNKLEINIPEKVIRGIIEAQIEYYLNQSKNYDQSV